ncbi:RfbC dTDP-4-dehydrorhamnose 3,5-epimerase and related enzymes [Candidatus Methylopumilus planktonicus]|uniref:dTDP-4-dehydrorhamnose 3,5-epimerase n=1 Tax=Candidatus Methylopumilus planktonicus TaxID=1581557 RepID=UPI003BEEEF62
MEFEQLAISDLILFKPKIFKDERGFFFESFQAQIFNEAVGRVVTFVQDNHSQSIKNTLRGLHYQVPPNPQGKLVRVTRGEVYDVAVDLRQSSPTFGKYVGTLLSSENNHQLWIPEGFAHGFITLSDSADFLYKTTDFYHSTSERSIRWDDKTLNIDWHLKGEVLLSSKDMIAKDFIEADYFE